MSLVSQFPESEFSTIYCTKLVVNPVTTDLKWNTSRRHPGIEILGFIDTVKTLKSEDTRGVLSNIGYLIASQEASWYLIINEPVLMYFGAAFQDQDLTTVEGVPVKQLISVRQTDRVRFVLTLAGTVIIRHERRNGDLVETFVHDVSIYTSQTLFPWVSTHPSNTMSVKIMLDVNFVIDVRTDGLVRMTGSKNDIIDFNLNDIYDNNGIPLGGIGASDIIMNNISGAYVKATDDGEVDIQGGINYKCDNITTSVSNYDLQVSEHVVLITNPAIITVRLPPVASTGKCRAYIVIRNYVFQVGETWQNPALKIIPWTGDTIELDLWVGLPPLTNIQVISDGINNWRIQ